MIDRNWFRTVVATVVATGVAAAILAAPAAAQFRGPMDAIQYRALVGLNPLGIPFDIGSFEVEGVVLPGVTVGAAASYNSLRGDPGAGGTDPRFSSGDLKVRYYPAEVALRGFAIGLALGITRYSSRVTTGTPAVTQREGVTAPTISIFADYNYLIGARQRFVVGTGAGAKRLLASEEDRRRADAPRAYPFVRFILGIAF